MNMKRKTWIMAAAGIAALALALAWAFAPRPVEVELASVAQGLFETAIDEDGKTRLAERFVVSAPLTGRLARITLREGDAVETGLVLATLTPVLPALQDDRMLRELRARVQIAEDGVQRAALRGERAKVSLTQAQNEARRSQQLAQQGFIAATKAESDQLTQLAVQRELEAANAERRMAGHELDMARAALSAVQPGNAASQRGFAVRSPVAGRVLRVHQSSEATIALGTPLIEIGDTARLDVVAELLTTDALAAVPGSRVRIDRWGGAGVLEGRVRAVEPAAFTKISALGVEEQRVRVLIDLTSPREQWQSLGDGFRVAVSIVTRSQPDAVVVPVSAVYPLPANAPTPQIRAASGASAGVSAGADGPAPGVPDAARHAVFVAEQGRARQVAVTLGGRNGSVAWIRAGLTPGQQVIVYPPAAVRDGVRIAARKV
jgi:HlyD family secretion protein